MEEPSTLASSGVVHFNIICDHFDIEFRVIDIEPSSIPDRFNLREHGRPRGISVLNGHGHLGRGGTVSDAIH